MSPVRPFNSFDYDLEAGCIFTLKLVFMGTPSFSIPVLSHLTENGHEVVKVYTRPDSRSGRNQRPNPSPIKIFARTRGLSILDPISLKPKDIQDELASLSPDLIVVSAYGLILPRRILDIPTQGCLNIHPSLLPKYRGPSPVSSAIAQGESHTGITIMLINELVDSGPIIAQRKIQIPPQENASEMISKLFQIGACLLVKILPDWIDGKIKAVSQNNEQATYTKRLIKRDGDIDWNLTPTKIVNQILGFYPWPGSYTRWNGKLLKILEATVSNQFGSSTKPGLVISLSGDALGITTPNGVVKILRLQLEGKKSVDSKEFLKGYPEFIGSTVNKSAQ